MIEKKLDEKKKLVVKKLKNIKQEFGTEKHFFKGGVSKLWNTF